MRARQFSFVITLVASAVSGCAAPKGAGGPGAPEAGGKATPADDSTEASPEALAMAEQARRDVEQLLQLPQGGDPATKVSDGGGARPTEIQWINLPNPSAADTGSPTGPAQATLPGDLVPIPADPPSLPPVDDTPGGGMLAELPGGSPEADRLRQLIVDLSAELYREAAYSDVPLRELLLIAATTMITPDRSLVPDALPGLTERERELLGRLQTHFSRLGRELVETGDPEALVAAIDALQRSLAKPVRLSLPRAALCTRVGGFGDYDEFPRNQAGRYTFLAHTGQQAVVYVEVEDFVSELDEQGKWVTELSQQLVVFSDRDGIPVWREDWQAGVDRSKNRRDDFFIVQIVTLPKALSVGRYQLKIHARDEKSGAETETTVEIEMVADPRMAAGG